MNLKYNTYHIFESGEKYYLFDNEKLISCIIDKRVFDALRNNDDSLLTEKDRDAFKLFHKHGVFFLDDPKKRYSFPKYDDVIISLALFHSCNLRCKYCFADSGNNFKGEKRCFNDHSLNAAIDFLLNDPFFSSFSYYRINLVSGGEPLLDKNLFRSFIRTAFNRFEKANKHLYIWFSTNGTLLTEEDLAFIGNYNVGYGISLDGAKDANDRVRIYKNGLGTYDDIVNNIRRIQNSAIVPNRLKELWGLMVYSQENIELYENIKHLKDIGFSTVQMRFVRSKDKNLVLNNNDAWENLNRFISTIFEKAISGDDSLLRLICNDSDYIGKIVKRIVLKSPVEVRCCAGSYMFSFAADGKIYPCDCFVGNSNFVMGDYYNGITEKQYKRFEDLSVNNRNKCRQCWAKYVCGGDCYHNSFINNGDIMIPDESYCFLILKVIELVIAFLNLYQAVNKEKYEAFCDFISIRKKMSLK